MNMKSPWFTAAFTSQSRDSHGSCIMATYRLKRPAGSYPVASLPPARLLAWRVAYWAPVNLEPFASSMASLPWPELKVVMEVEALVPEAQVV